MPPGSMRLSDEMAPAGDLPAVPVLKSGAVTLNYNLDPLGKVRDILRAILQLWWASATSSSMSRLSR